MNRHAERRQVRRELRGKPFPWMKALVIGAFAIGMLFFLKDDKKEEPKEEAAAQENTQVKDKMETEDVAEMIDFAAVEKSLKEEPVFPDFVAVAMFRDGVFKGMGTFLPKNNVVVTCEHLFRSDKRGVWEFRELAKEHKYFGFITDVKRRVDNGNESPDIAICSVSQTEKKVIDGFSEIRSRHETSNTTWFPKDRREEIVSTVDGSSLQVVAVITDSQPSMFPVFIAKNRSAYGWSGAGYRWKSTLLILQGGSKLPPDKVIPPDVEEEGRFVTFLAPFSQIEMHQEK